MHTLAQNKKATRQIVSWSSKEDNILREQIGILGMYNWAYIASKFTNKTTRQCRRRWFTYLNSDYKKGGWSAEEDNLLCQAQKIFGNRWTRIAKVVSGRTDNAVKNRFSTLCKRRTKLAPSAEENATRVKHEGLAKENATPYVNLNSKRVDTNSSEVSETRVPYKKMRRGSSDIIERQQEEFRRTNEQLRPSLAVIGQKVDILRDLETQANTDMIQRTYLGKDKPEIIALMHQAELPGSHALKSNIKNTQQTTNSAWKIENSEDLVEDSKNSREYCQQSWRASQLYVDSPGSPDYNRGSTLLTHMAFVKPEHVASDFCATLRNTGADPQPNKLGQSNVDCDVVKDAVSCETTNQSGEILSKNIMLSFDDLKANDGTFYDFSSNEFDFPLQVTSLFRSLASGVPSPQFTESEREFLLKTLGVEAAQKGASSRPMINT